MKIIPHMEINIIIGLEHAKEEAFAEKIKYPDGILVGEDRDPIPDFDYNNSPSDIAKLYLSNVGVAVHRSSVGTQGLKAVSSLNFTIVHSICFGSFVVFNSLIRYIQQEIQYTPKHNLSILCTTDHADDLFFAQYLKESLQLGNNMPTLDFRKEVEELCQM